MTWTRIQQASAALSNAFSGATATLTPTYGAGTTAGNLLVAFVNWASQFTTWGAGDSFTLPAGWVRADHTPTGNNNYEELWYYPNNPGGITSVSITSTRPGGVNNAVFQTWIGEYSGGATASPLDQHANATGTGTAVSISTASADAQSGNLVIMCVGWQTTTLRSFSAGSGYSAETVTQSNNTVQDNLFGEDATSSGATTQTATGTISASQTWGAVIATFAPAPPTTTAAGAFTPGAFSMGGAARSFSGAASFTPGPFVWAAAGRGEVARTAFQLGPFTLGATATEAPPTITGIAPIAAAAEGGTAITITGTNFLGTTAVVICAVGGSSGTAATSVVVVNSTSITCVIPAISTGGLNVTQEIRVTAHGLISALNAPNDELQLGPRPLVSAVTPNQGGSAGGTSITIGGLHFTAPSGGATTVSVGGVSATGVVVTSDTQLTCTVPAHAAGSTDTIVTAFGASVVAAGDQFRFVGAPTITGVTPAGGPMAGGTVVAISGTDLDLVTGVLFGALVCTAFTPGLATALRAVAPVNTSVTDQTVAIVVSSAFGSSSTSAADQYTYQVPPSVTGVSPNSGPAGASTSGVVITGTAFENVVNVFFGAIPAASYVVDSVTQITAVAPVSYPSSVDVTVVTLGGRSPTASADRFTYAQAASVRTLLPAYGPAAGGTTVTILGRGFDNTCTVAFGATSATSPTYVSPTKLTAVSPAGSGLVDVTVTKNSVVSGVSSADQFQYFDDGAGQQPVTGAFQGRPRVIGALRGRSPYGGSSRGRPLVNGALRGRNT